VCVGRHHCWAAGPLGLGLNLSIYCIPSIINTSNNSLPTWYQRVRFRVSFLSPPTAAVGLLPHQPPACSNAPTPGSSLLGAATIPTASSKFPAADHLLQPPVAPSPGAPARPLPCTSLAPGSTSSSHGMPPPDCACLSAARTRDSLRRR
jgi:hypothetical protein